MYIRMYICMHVFPNNILQKICMYVHCLCKYIRLYVCTHTHTHTHKFVRTYMRVCTYVRMYVCMYVHVYAHTLAWSHTQHLRKHLQVVTLVGTHVFSTCQFLASQEHAESIPTHHSHYMKWWQHVCYQTADMDDWPVTCTCMLIRNTNSTIQNTDSTYILYVRM